MFRPVLLLIPGSKPWRRARLRNVMRGYRILKNTGHGDAIANVKQALTVRSLDLAEAMFSSTVLGWAVRSAEVALRQYLLLRIGGVNLNSALMIAVAKPDKGVVFPLPKQWRAVVSQHGFRVNRWRCALLWQLYVCLLIGYGVLQILKSAAEGIVRRPGMPPQMERYAYFADLAPGNLPDRAGSPSHDIVSWYLGWPGRREVDAVRHGVRGINTFIKDGMCIRAQTGPLPPLADAGEALRYLGWGMKAVVISVVDMLRGRWWHGVLLNQAALAARARMLPAESLAQEYLFHISNWIYRPLWTYEVAMRGASILFYFYSTNCEAVKRNDMRLPLYYGWEAMNWPRYLVWDDYQADFVRRAVGARSVPNIDIVGDIPFEGAGQLPADVSAQRFVAVFDVQPTRESFYRTLGVGFNYYTPAVSTPFMLDICDAIKRYGLVLAWKRKRNIGRRAHPLFRRLADQLAEERHVIPVDPGIAAACLIQSSVAVISMPFTSTALIARTLRKPSVYYDPTGQLHRDDRAAHGIPILLSKQELDAWLSSLATIH